MRSRTHEVRESRGLISFRIICLLLFAWVGASEGFAKDDLFYQARVLQKEGRISEAAQVYLTFIDQSSDAGQRLQAQRDLALLYIQSEQYDQADRECEQLINNYDRCQGVVEALYQVANAYALAGNDEKHDELYEYIQTRWFESKTSINCQCDKVHDAVEDGNDLEEQAALDLLLDQYADHNDIARAIYNLAGYYRDRAETEMAVLLYDYDVVSDANGHYGLWSQIEIVKTYIEAGEDAAAAKACKRLINDRYSTYDKLPYTVHGFGVNYTKAHKPGCAEVYYRYVLEQWEGYPQARWAELAILDGEGRPEEDEAVRAALGRLLESLPQQNLTSQDIYKMALELAQKQAKPERAIALHQVNFEGGQTDQYSVWSAIELVKGHIRAGRNAEAEKVYEAMLVQYASLEELPEIIYLFGDIYIETAQYEKAEEMYRLIEQTWTRDGKTIWAQIGRTRSFIAQCDIDQAETIFQEMMSEYSQCPGLVEAVRIIGESYWKQSMSHITSRSRGASRNTNQSTEDYDEELAVIYAQCGLRSLEKFELIIEQLPEDSVNTPYAYHMAGLRYSYRGERQKAIEYFQEVCDKWPDYKGAEYLPSRIGDLYLKRGEVGEISREEADSKAKQAYEAQLSKYPNSPATKSVRSWLDLNNSIETGQDKEI